MVQRTAIRLRAVIQHLDKVQDRNDLGVSLNLLFRVVVLVAS